MRIMSKERIRLNALAAINEIEDDLITDRGGLRQAWVQIDEGTQQDILEKWLLLVLTAFGYCKRRHDVVDITTLETLASVDLERKVQLAIQGKCRRRGRRMALQGHRRRGWSHYKEV